MSDSNDEVEEVDEVEDDEEVDERLELMGRLLDSENEVRALRAQLDSQRVLLASLQAIVSSSGEQHIQAMRSHDLPPLIEAVMRGDVQMVALLIDRAPVESRRLLEAALQAACEHGHRAVAHELITQGADVNADHGSAIMWACRNGDAELCLLLLEAGADGNVLNGCPLRTAVRGGHTSVVEVLLGSGEVAAYSGHD